MDELEKKIEEAKESDGYFITISQRNGTNLKHYQVHSKTFYPEDLVNSLNEIRKLIAKEYAHIEN